jgi:hypothetical protein
VDVDNAFPAMVERPTGRRSSAVPGDLGPQVESALRDVLGWRPRAEDPGAFTAALTAAFRLEVVEGHVRSEFVPRGYAVQADLGAVTGGQASLYRRATMVRGEALRILDALVPLRSDADDNDMDSYRLLVRNGVERLVDEIGAAGGPRVQMVHMYFAGLTGRAEPRPHTSPDSVAGQLGALRDRFGLTDDNVNTVEEEGVRTAFWTLVDLLTDLHASWFRQAQMFAGGNGFLGTELILLSRLMEAAADQVEEVEDVLDSVLVAESERRTLVLDAATGLTLDGLLTWLHDFLSHEGRRIAQEGGRDGIVSALAPMAVHLVKTFREFLADPVSSEGLLQVKTNGAPIYEGAHHVDAATLPVLYLPASCCSLPAGLYAARTRIAVAALCRLLTDFAKLAQRIGRWSQPVLINVTLAPVATRDGVVELRVRGFNLRPEHIPCFVPPDAFDGSDPCDLEQYDVARLVLPIEGSSTADEDSVSALFRWPLVTKALGDAVPRRLQSVTVTSADRLPLALLNGVTGSVEVAPEVVTYPVLVEAATPVTPAAEARAAALKKVWDGLPSSRAFQTVLQERLGDLPDPEPEPDHEVDVEVGHVGHEGHVATERIGTERMATAQPQQGAALKRWTKAVAQAADDLVRATDDEARVAAQERLDAVLQKFPN